MTSEKTESLLVEYEICNEQVGRLDSLIWQTASVVFPITLAGFAYFGLNSNHTSEEFFVLTAVGVGSIVLIIAWYLLSRTWYSYQGIGYYRMREIENELGLFHYRYSGFIRRSKKHRQVLLAEMKETDKPNFLPLSEKLATFTPVGIRATTTIISAIFSIGWLILIVREYMLTYM